MSLTLMGAANALILALPDPLAEGWLLGVMAMIVALVPTMLSILRAVANRWKVPLKELESENQRLKEEAVVRTNALTNANLKAMLLEAKVEDLKGDLDRWRSERWRGRDNG